VRGRQRRQIFLVGGLVFCLLLSCLEFVVGEGLRNPLWVELVREDCVVFRYLKGRNEIRNPGERKIIKLNYIEFQSSGSSLEHCITANVIKMRDLSGYPAHFL
jgi:hypothetical protein